MWTLDEDRAPADPEARELHVTLAVSGPRFATPDGEFAIWSATVGEDRDGEPVTLRGALGHVQPGEQLVVAGAYEQHARYGWQFGVETFRSALPVSADGVALWLRRRCPGSARRSRGPSSTTSARRTSSPSSTATRSGCVR